MNNSKNNNLTIIYNTEPKKQNILYAFQRLITPLSIATKYNVYEKDKSLIESIFNMVVNWAIIYDETSNISCISDSEIDYVETKLYDLDGKYLSSKGLYFEEAYEWILQLKNIYKKGGI